MTPEPSESAIIVEDLVKTYAGVTAVNKVSFTVKRGEILGFLGPNGAGKSTTMRILTGYLSATSGSVTLCGVPVATEPDRVKKLIGYMPENNPLPEDMRVSEYLNYRGRLKEIPRKKLSKRIEEVLSLCDLSRVRHRVIGQLSKGNKQRVGIADAVLAEPPVIIMDEPTIGLDPHQIQLVRDLIGTLRGRMTVIISSHILPEIEMTCDRVLIINQGRVVACGSPAELRTEILGHSRYRVEVAGLQGELEEVLRGVDASLKVTLHQPADASGFAIYHLQSDKAEDLGETLLRALVSAPALRVREVSRDHPSLEDVFLAATRRTWEIVDAKKPTA